MEEKMVVNNGDEVMLEDSWVLTCVFISLSPIGSAH